MTLKEATANSLLMFVAATCVVLIVKAVPQTPPETPQAGASSNARSSGQAENANAGKPGAVQPDGVKVYYFHGNTRCPTCQTIEAYAEEAVRSGFPEELARRAVQWEVINYESPGNEHYATEYQIVAPSVVLAKFEGGKQVAWKGLMEVWELVGDKAAFADFVQKNVRAFLQGTEAAKDAPSNPVRPSSADQPPPLPVPQ